MKYVKLYEDYGTGANPDYFAYSDDTFRIHKILHGVNKGKILFKFYDQSNDGFTSLSVASGCATILGTEYEKNKKVREITIDENPRFRRVQQNTTDFILKQFLIQMGFNKNDRELFWNSDLMIKLKLSFGDDIQECLDIAKTIGDILDYLGKIKKKVFDFEDLYLTKSVDKYNL